MSYDEVDAVRLVRPMGVKDADNIILNAFIDSGVGSFYE
jgi:hypothetical protein